MCQVLENHLQFLSGGGEMGELIRAKDWSKTPIGKPENWPQSLRTMVSVMLDNPFGMYIAWGPGYTQLYNDGYRPILGYNKHPQALGIGTRETFAEIWYIIGSMFDGVMNGKAVGFPDFMLPLNRNGFVEECYFDFSYSPIRKEDGEVGGVLVTVIETTNKKKAEDNLKESEERFRTMAENIPNLAWMAKADGWIYWYNKKWYEYTGTTPEQMEGWGWQSVHDPATLPLVMEKWQASITTGEEFEMVFPIKGADGKFRKFLTRVLPVKDEEGKIRQWFGSNTDITKQKETEEALQQSKDQLEFAIEATSLGTWEYNPLTHKFISNQRLKEWFGIGTEEHIELMHAVNAIHEHDRQRVTDAIQKALDYSSGGNYNIEYTIVHPVTKKQTIVYAKGKAFFNDEKIAYRFNGTLEDITEQAAATKKIEESEARFRSLIAQSPMAMIVLKGPEHFIDVVNGAMLKRWNKTEPALLNKKISDIFPEIKDQKFFALLNEVYKTGKVYRETEAVSYLQSKEGKNTFYVDFEYSPLFEADGSVSGVIVTVNDVTEKVETRKKIEESEERYHTLIYSSPSAIAILYGEELVITIANDAIIQIWGKGKEIMGKPYFEALPELVEQGYKEVFAQVYKTGIPFSAVETPVQLLQNGVMQEKYYNFLLYPQRNINGEIDGIGIIATEVTSQALLNNKVKESEQRFAAAVQAVKGIVWTNNDKGEMTGEQQGWASLTGQTYNEYQGYGWAKAVHPDDAQPTIEAWKEAVKKAKTFNFEHRVKTKDGTWRDFSIKAIPLLNDDGTLRQWVGVHTDITESKQAAKTLRDNEEKLNIVINASELGTWEIDVKTGKVTSSERFLEIMGFKQKIDLTLNDTVKRLHPDYLQLRNEAFKKAYETGVLYFTGPVIWQDDSLHWVESKGKVFYDEQKKPVTIIGTIADITEHKRHEQILFESEQKFRVLADSMPQHIWTSDPEGNLNYYNRSVFDYSGLTLEQINKDGWIQIIHPDDREENIRQWTNSIITGKDFLLEHRFRRHDGVYRWQLSRAIPQKDENGKIQMWVGTSTDIQDIKELDQQKDSFLSMASHELKTPVTTIKAYGQIAEAMLAKNGDTETLGMVTKMGTQVNRLTNLIGDLLDITRIQKGKLRYNEDMFDFNEVVKEVVDDMQKTSASHTIENHPGKQVKIYGDKDKISQVLNNLISNAIKYSPKANSIIVDTQVKENGIELSVKDFGIGIPAEERANVFEQFYRVNGNNQSTFPGMGIGLFICSEITKMHGGKIWADSIMGKGSTFYMWLPFDHREINNNKIPD